LVTVTAQCEVGPFTVTVAGAQVWLIRTAPTRLRKPTGRCTVRLPDEGTGDHAPLNALDLRHGYTVEMFLKLPTDFGDANAWCGLLTRMGTGGQAGKNGDDPSEPVGTMNLSGGAQAQWAVYPLNQNRIITNWSHLLPLGTWWHLAVVNDGTHTVMYVDGCPGVRNPSTPAAGVATTGEFWMLGAYHYNRVVEQTLYGWLGDVRIVDRPLPVDRFLLSGR
jgi:hypothetical protein